MKVSKQFEIKDSGERRDFDSGATRDVDHDKPRFDLIPMTALQKIVAYYPDIEELNLKSDDIFNSDDSLSDDTKAKMWSKGLLWGMTTDENLLLDIAWIGLCAIQREEHDYCLDIEESLYYGFNRISPKTYLRLANHYGGGAKKYDPWNWSKGMPFSVFHASLMRHIFAILTNKTDEDHLSAIFFNVAAILHFQIIKREDVDDITSRLTEWFPNRNSENGTN